MKKIIYILILGMILSSCLNNEDKKIYETQTGNQIESNTQTSAVLDVSTEDTVILDTNTGSNTGESAINPFANINTGATTTGENSGALENSSTGEIMNATGSTSTGDLNTNNNTMGNKKEIMTGLTYEKISDGSGEVVNSGDKVKVHYTGKLTTGETFDSSVTRGELFEFVLGAGQVIKGWDEGIKGMKVGEKGILTIAPELGYGSQSIGSIPANSTLIFEVEIIGK